MQDFLVELGFEELPARFVENAVQQLANVLQTRLKEQRLQHGEVSLYSTPRRLAVLIKGLQLQQDDLETEVKGPPKNIAYDQEGNLTQAGQGFLRSQGVEADAIEIRQFQGADYLYIKKHVAGKETSLIIKEILEDVIPNLSFPKNMRWGSLDLRLARPLRWIIALLGSEVVPVQVANVVAGRRTLGHRQLSPGFLTLTTPAEYVSTLEAHYVLPDASKRKKLIEEQIKNIAEQQQAVIQGDERLLLELVNLVEYPTAFCGEFPAEYLEIPPEVLITSMKEHQRYFPLWDSTDKLLPKFVGVRNGADNHLATVVRGNEKVLAARLADAKFFFDEDQKVSLASNAAKLTRVVFQEGLGTMGEKVKRIQRLSVLLAEQLGFAHKKDTILRTAELAKADLVTQMVNEFPELQGVMGEKYALLQGEKEVVAKGIKEHYLPRFAGDVLPETVEGLVVALADKLDTLIGYFALGKIPSGSQDPFALRRQAQGIVQIMLNRKIEIPLTTFIELGAGGYAEVKLEEQERQALLEFFLARLRVILRERGYSHDIIDTVMASRDERVSVLSDKVATLTEFRTKAEFQDLTTGFERIANLANKADGNKLDSGKLQLPDRTFKDAIDSLEEQCMLNFTQGDFSGVLTNLANFRKAIDIYFDAVMIMDEDPIVRDNRLTLLKKAFEVYILYGDFRQIVVNK